MRFIWMIGFCLQTLTFANDRGFLAHEREELIKALTPGLYTASQLDRLFQHPHARKMPKMVSLNVTNPITLKKETYAHFASPGSLQKAVYFSQKHYSALKKTANLTGVPPELVVAILLIETNLGTYTGTYPLLSIYPSIFVAATELLKRPLSSKQKNRVLRKKDWALAQIKALLTMRHDHQINIQNLKGSYAGAIGIPQFIPTSYVSFAKSYHDRSPDLFKLEDAIHSVAHYLTSHGYHKKISFKELEKVIWTYNNSQVYVDIVLEVAQALKRHGHWQLKALAGIYGGK